MGPLGFRPHVWGFFFHKVGISWKIKQGSWFSSPCLGILFSLDYEAQQCGLLPLEVFVPMFGDSFFTALLNKEDKIMTDAGFRPHVWGFFFHRGVSCVYRRKCDGVFVPMFGDSFFTGKKERFIMEKSAFSSPCLGILFSRSIKVGKAFPATVFSSPCLGILFSQQARDAPRSGLSMALLRRGFPIDWNSHYFHPLTYCFLRFHAYRRGFLLL